MKQYALFGEYGEFIECYSTYALAEAARLYLAIMTTQKYSRLYIIKEEV